MANDMTVWTPPESKSMQAVVKWGGIAAIAGGGIYAFTQFAPTLVDAIRLLDTITQDATHMAVSGVVLVATLWLAREILSPAGAINKLLRLPYWMLINGLTRTFITIDPLSPIDERLKSVLADKEQFEAQFERFDGIISTIRDKEAECREKSDQAGKKALAAKARNMAAAYDVNLSAAQQFDAAAKNYTAMRARLEPARATFQSIAQQCDVTAQKLQTERSILASKWAIQQSVDTAVKSASRVLGRSKTDVWNMAQQAEDVIDTKYSEELGHLDHLKSYADPFIQSIDLDNATYSDDLLKKMQAGSTKLIASASATPMPDTAALPQPGVGNDPTLASLIR